MRAFSQFGEPGAEPLSRYAHQPELMNIRLQGLNDRPRARVSSGLRMSPGQGRRRTQQEVVLAVVLSPRS
jgi:hypothetical protein